MRIGQLSGKSGLSVHALRFYERQGLLPGVMRGPTNYREYSTRTLDRLVLIQEARALGFTLTEIRGLLDAPTTSMCDTLRACAERKVKQIDTQIRQLRSTKQRLTQLLRACGTPSTRSCPVAQTLMIVNGWRTDR